MTVTMNSALLLIRIVIGLILVAHGAQKLFGWFGGSGLVQMRQFLESQGYKPAWFWAGLAIIGEFGGGVSLALGFLTPLGAAGIFGAMVMAGRMHWKNGLFAQNGGYEYPLALAIVSLGIGLIGPGSYSLDSLLGIALPEALVFSVLAGAALLVDLIGIMIVSRAGAEAQHGSASKAS